MKATGIVRRIDDLGRVVIPKEIRRTLRIREGDPLEIFVDREGEVILKKYSPIGELGDFAKEYADSLYESTDILLYRRSGMVIAQLGRLRRFLDKNLRAAEKAIEERKVVLTPKPGEHKYCDACPVKGRGKCKFVQVIADYCQGNPIGVDSIK